MLFHNCSWEKLRIQICIIVLRNYLIIIYIYNIYIIHHHHCAAIVSRGWAKASSCCFHICLSCAILCQMVPFQELSSSCLHRLAGLPLRLMFPCHMSSLEVCMSCLFKHVPLLSLKMSQCLANVVHPAVILL